MFCIVSWHHEGQDLRFWDGAAWGVSNEALFFQVRKEAAAALRKMKRVTSDGFLKPNVLDVSAFNKRFGKSVGPRPQPLIQAPARLDRKTGIFERTNERNRL